MSSKILAGKVAVITGGSTGIGLATAKRFIAEGASVFITGRRQKELDDAVAEIGGDATGVQADSSKLADLDRLYAQIQQTKGKVDIVVANAGVLESAPPRPCSSSLPTQRVTSTPPTSTSMAAGRRSERRKLPARKLSRELR